MTDPIELTIRGTDEVVAFACPKCSRICNQHLENPVSISADDLRRKKLRLDDAHQAAERCCDRRCERCKTPIGSIRDTPYIYCKSCLAEHEREKEAAKYAKATKIDEADYSGWVNWEDRGYNNGYFESIDDLREWAAGEGISFPKYVYACSTMNVPSRLDADDILCTVLENDEAFEDAIDCLDVDGLQKLMDDWLKTNTHPCYQEDSTRAVVLSEELNAKFRKEAEDELKDVDTP